MTPFPGPKDRISDQERAAIDAAIAAGRVTLVPPGLAAGLSTIESVLGVATLVGQSEGLLAAARRGGAVSAYRAALAERKVA